MRTIIQHHWRAWPKLGSTAIIGLFLSCTMANPHYISEASNGSPVPQGSQATAEPTRRILEVGQAARTPGTIGPLVENTDPPPTWYNLAEAVADRVALNSAFAADTTSLSKNAFIMAARVSQGLDQPSFQFFSYQDTGFEYSPGNFWPAGTMRLMAAVGAMQTLYERGLTSASHLTFEDRTFEGTVQDLVTAAFVQSNTAAYDRLIQVAGVDDINGRYFTPEGGFPHIILQRAYSTSPRIDIRQSPAITYQDGETEGQIPARQGSIFDPTCPSSGNCTTLFEILDIIRRVTLHNRIPAKERFNISPSDATTLQEALMQSQDSALRNAAQKRWGSTANIYSLTGQVNGADHLDHGLLVNPTSGENYLVAWSIPYGPGSNAQGEALTIAILDILEHYPRTTPPVQLDAGVPIRVGLDSVGQGKLPGSHTYRIKVKADGADNLRIWVGRWALPSPIQKDDGFVLDHDFNQFGARVMVIEAFKEGKIIGHRTTTIHVEQTT